MDGALLSVEDGMNAPEDNICLLFPTMPFPLSFDNPFVVPINLEVSTTTAG